MRVCIHTVWFSLCTVEHRPRWMALGKRKRFFFRIGCLFRHHWTVSL